MEGNNLPGNVTSSPNILKRKLVEDYGTDSDSDLSDEQEIKKVCVEQDKTTSEELNKYQAIDIVSGTNKLTNESIEKIASLESQSLIKLDNFSNVIPDNESHSSEIISCKKDKPTEITVTNTEEPFNKGNKVVADSTEIISDKDKSSSEIVPDAGNNDKVFEISTDKAGESKASSNLIETSIKVLQEAQECSSNKSNQEISGTSTTDIEIKLKSDLTEHNENDKLSATNTIKDNEIETTNMEEVQVMKSTEIITKDSNSDEVSISDLCTEVQESRIICGTELSEEAIETNHVPEPFSATKDEEVFLQISDNAQSAPSDDKAIEKVPTLSESLKKAVQCEDSFGKKSLELSEDKKEESIMMEVDTPIDSLIDTPCESGETSPATSAPADSCQASAAPSPLLREDTIPVSTDVGLDDDSSKDVIEMEEEKKEENAEIGVGLLRGRAKKAALKAKRSEAARKKNLETAKKRKAAALAIDEETRMSANGEKIGLDDDDSQSSVIINKRKVRSFRSEIIVPESTEDFTACKIVEYQWPLENGEHYFIQEHMAQYLEITSFKRKYKDVRRRPIESQEKEYLRELGLVTEMACDLGLTAVRSDDTLDVLFKDFPSKYEELSKILRERNENLLREKGKVEYSQANLDKSKMEEYSRKAALNAAKWNAAFNRERREERRYSFDLDSFTLHVPYQKYFKRPSEMTKISSYPVAVLPGQYTDYYKKYSYQELKCLPLQSVLHGPFTAEELAVDSDEECVANGDGQIGDSKELCLIDQDPIPSAPIDPLSAEKQHRCKSCNGGRDRNKNGNPEPLIICGTCRSASHPTCIDLTLGMIDKIESYSWQCMDCKTCVQCNDPDDEEKMIFCDMCDRGFHIYCVGLRKVPNGRWHCKNCAVCFTCGARTPSGMEQHIKNAEWQHEFKKSKDNKHLKYACTLCVPCDKYWKRRQFCAVCLKVYRSIPEDGMVRCAGCPKYVHKEGGCSVSFDSERYCTVCYKDRTNTALNHSRILAAAKKKMLSSY